MTTTYFQVNRKFFFPYIVGRLGASECGRVGQVRALGNGKDGSRTRNEKVQDSSRRAGVDVVEKESSNQGHVRLRHEIATERSSR